MASSHRATWRRLIGSLLVAVLASAGLTACTVDTDGASRSLETFLDAWRDGTVPDEQERYERIVSGLDTAAPELEPGEVTADGDTATAPVTVTWTLAAGTRWRYETTVRLRQTDGTWRVDWSPRTVHPDLADGQRLVRRQGEDTRAPILGGDGEPITAARPVVVVGVQPSLVTSADQLARVLGAALAADQVDTRGLPQQISNAAPDAFVPVVTLRQERYDQVRPAIYDLPGTVFRKETRVLAPTREYARALLGTVGPVTKEHLDAEPGRYQVRDQVGQGGLQARYDERLRGRPAVTVAVVGENETTGQGKEVFRADAEPGEPVRTTLDDGVQRAADAAVGTGDKTTAIVAIRVSDGSVLAVANSPRAGAQNLAMSAQVPPGSTFKVVSALTLLNSDAVDLDQPVPCPAVATVEGRQFKNAWNGGLDAATFRDAFAHSCNTAFVHLAPELSPTGLADTAATLGVGRDWDLGVPVYTGSVPVNSPPVDAAAAAFGQGRTVVSPMVMAGAVAGVARGQWRQPTLVVDPEPDARAEDGPKLDDGTADKLRTVMREVVTRGSATALNDVDGEPVHGKTGTAEYGTETPPRSHSWFAGWQGDIAFAVFVEDGGNDVSLAVATTGRFLAGLR